MKVIVDTSIWIEHLRKPIPKLEELLTERRVLVHPVVIGELACGSLKKRNQFLGNLKILPRASESKFEETLELIEIEELYGRGLGYGDIQILASALLSDAGVLTRDRALLSAARFLGIMSPA